MMACFLMETRKALLDYLVKMHDQFIIDMLRKVKHIHERKYREFRKRQKKTIDTVLDTTLLIIDWSDDKPLYKTDIWKQISEKQLLESMTDLHNFKRLEEREYGDILLERYPSLRKYFAEFIQLPFAVKSGTEPLMNIINLVRQLDAGTLKKIPDNAPTGFIPQELRRSYKDKDGNIKHNAWELGLAIAMKEALRSGDLYLPRSKQHVSF